MRRFRVGMVMLLAAGLMVLSSGRAQAVIGIPDDVPAATLLYPFFKVNPTPTDLSRQDSLVVVTNTANTSVYAHVTIWTVNSIHVYDFTVLLTPHDVFSCSLLDLLVNPNGVANPCGTFQAPVGVIADLTDAGSLVGYVTVDTVSGPTSLFPGQGGYPFVDWNILIGHLYLVNLPAGSSTGFNAVSLEAFIFPGTGATFTGFGRGQPAFALSSFEFGFYLTRCIEEQTAAPCIPFGTYGNRERIDGISGDFAQTFSGDAVTSTLRLLVRYFSATELNGRSEIWLWKDRVTSGTGAGVSVAVYDEAENVHSIQFQLPREVNFAPTAAIITPGAPGGWFRMAFPCSPFGFCSYPTAGASTSVGGVPIQAVAYSLQFADSLGSGGEQARFLRWDAAFPAHRQYTDYIGVGE